MPHKALANYIKDSFRELHNVTWPTKNQAIRLTIIVLAFCFISAGLLLLVDLALSKVYEYFFI